MASPPSPSPAPHGTLVLAARIGWIALRLTLVWLMMNAGRAFVYQF